MKRREFITLLGGAITWPLAARAQQERMRRIAVLMGGPDDAVWSPRVAVFRQALGQLGWSDGHNIVTEIRWGAGDQERIKALAAELASLKPEVILAGPTNALVPLQRQTRSIPIVFVSVSDPLGQGIVESLARPTGNVTGFSNLEFSLLGKWLQHLKEIAPGIARVAVMISTSNAVSVSWFRTFHTLAPSFAVEPIDAPIQERADIERTIEALGHRPGGGLIVPGDTFVSRPDVRGLVIGLTAQHRIPALYTVPEFVRDGGLMCYGVDQIDPYRRAAAYVDRILKGETPGDLPVQQPTKFELVVNLRTAKALGLTVPLTLQASADEVIE
jgi:putative tryptophan/tyrosine transport system substrate-binding protein